MLNLLACSSDMGGRHVWHICTFRKKTHALTYTSVNTLNFLNRQFEASWQLIGQQRSSCWLEVIFKFQRTHKSGFWLVKYVHYLELQWASTFEAAWHVYALHSFVRSNFTVLCSRYSLKKLPNYSLFLVLRAKLGKFYFQTRALLIQLHEEKTIIAVRLTLVWGLLHV